MNIRVVPAVLGLAAVLGAGAAIAQQPATVARLTDLEGNVLVSRGDAMAAAVNNQRVAVGTRVLTTAGAKVTVDYDVGCDVRLNENQRFVVRVGECAVLLTEVVPLGPASGAIGGGAVAATGGAASGIVGGTVIGLGLGLVLRDSNECDKCPVSPN